MALRSESIPVPVREPGDAARMAEILSLLDAMGVLRIHEPVATLDSRVVADAAAAAAGVGIGRDLPALLASRPHDARTVAAVIRRLADALEDSPAPLQETRELLAVFGPDLLAPLAGASPASLRRYASGLRAVPDRTAARLHRLARIVGYLRGAYNDAGIRRWFERPRPQLDGRAPAALLSGDWSPDDASADAVTRLAQALLAGGAT